MTFPKRILLIDHEPHLTAVVGSALQATGRYLIRQEKHSRRALHSALHFQPDLILLDAVPEHLEVDEIAQQRGLSAGTIAQHLADLVAAGEIDDVRQWVDDITLGKIRRMADGGPVGLLGPLKESFGESVTYEQLHLARAYLNRESTRAPAGV